MVVSVINPAFRYLFSASACSYVELNEFKLSKLQYFPSLISISLHFQTLVTKEGWERPLMALLIKRENQQTLVNGNLCKYNLNIIMNCKEGKLSWDVNNTEGQSSGLASMKGDCGRESCIITMVKDGEKNELGWSRGNGQDWTSFKLRTPFLSMDNNEVNRSRRRVRRSAVIRF